MLPNHSPLVIAEQFGTLESLYPGRIDLGLGRPRDRPAHGPRAAPRPAERRPLPARRAGPPGAARRHTDHPIRAIPGTGLEVPLWILGSSTYGAASLRCSGSRCLRLALRAHRPHWPRSSSTERVPVVAAVRGALRDGGPDVLRSRDGRRGSQSLHDAAAAGEPLPRSPGPTRRPSTTSSRTGCRPRRRRPRCSCTRRRFTRDRARGRRPLPRSTPASTSHGRLGDHDHAARVRSYEILAEAV